MKQIHPIAPINQYVIDFVRSLRKKHRLTQAGLADILLVHKSIIANIEWPYHPVKYNLGHINTIAWFLEVPPCDFLPKQAFDPDIIITH